MRSGIKTSEFWLIALVLLIAGVLLVLGWDGEKIFKALIAPGFSAAVYAAVRTWLKRQSFSLLETMMSNTSTSGAATTATPASTVASILEDPSAYVDATLEKLIASKIPSAAAFQPETNALIEAGVALGWKVLEKAVLARLVAKYPQLGTVLTDAGVKL
jgi:hypothetical protein